LVVRSLSSETPRCHPFRGPGDKRPSALIRRDVPVIAVVEIGDFALDFPRPGRIHACRYTFGARRVVDDEFITVSAGTIFDRNEIGRAAERANVTYFRRIFDGLSVGNSLRPRPSKRICRRKFPAIFRPPDVYVKVRFVPVHVIYRTVYIANYTAAAYFYLPPNSTYVLVERAGEFS